MLYLGTRASNWVAARATRASHLNRFTILCSLMFWSKSSKNWLEGKQVWFSHVRASTGQSRPKKALAYVVFDPENVKRFEEQRPRRELYALIASLRFSLVRCVHLGDVLVCILDGSDLANGHP
jgi:hypothetical protein